MRHAIHVRPAELLPEPITIYLNGEKRQVRRAAIPVIKLVQLAGAAAAVDVNRANEYYVETLEDPIVKYEEPMKDVPLQDGTRLLILHRGRTPVA